MHARILSSYLDLALACQQNVVELYVPVQYALAVAVVKSVQELLEYELGHRFLQPTSFPHVGQQISPCAEFLNVEEMLLGLEGLVKTSIRY